MSKITSINYRKIAHLIAQNEILINQNKIKCKFYGSLEINNRISQIIAYKLTEEILRELNKNNEINLIDLRNYVINLNENIIIPKLKLRIKLLLKFILLWVLVLITLLFKILKNSGTKKNENVTLFYGVPAESIVNNVKRKKFEEYCNYSDINALTTSKKLLIQTVLPIKDKNSKFIYCRYPIFNIDNFYVSFKQDIKFVFKKHIDILFNYLHLVNNNSIYSELWRDFAFHTIVDFFNNKGLINNVIITNTNWLSQELWMSSLFDRKYKTHMILYSLNSSPIKFKNDQNPGSHPGIKFLRSDFIYIWSELYTRVLKKEQINSKTITVNPVTWEIFNKKCEYKKSKILNICIFDILPLNNAGLNYWGLNTSYYNSEVLTSFISDIIYAVEKIKVNFKQTIIFLKQKRSSHKFHDRKYTDFLSKIGLSCNYIIPLNLDVSINELISKCDLCIVFPFSSPVYIADKLNIPSIFYDPTGSVIFDESVYPLSVTFCNSKEDLMKKMCEILIDNKQ